MVSLKKPMSGIWQPQKGDKFDKRGLLEMEKFFIKDLKDSEKYLKYVLRFAGYKLTPSKKGMSDMIGVARRDVSVSKTNLAIVRHLLK